MHSLFSLLVQMCIRMQNLKVTRALYALLKSTGLIHLSHLLFHWWFSHHPSQQMLNDREFFLRHKDDLKKVYISLEDDRSKLVFENVLRYRFTAERNYLLEAQGDDSAETQYFVPEIQFSDHEVIVDCGAYIGDTAQKFKAASPGCLIIGLEPDDKNYQQLSSLQYDCLVAYKCGAWSKDTTLTFSNSGGGTGCGAISEAGNLKIEARALDNLPECKDATFIKMDIEGAELEALKGAENIIRTNKPKLAICLYHNPSDLFTIPLYLRGLNLGYKFYIHYHPAWPVSDNPAWSIADTVLYAV